MAQGIPSVAARRILKLMDESLSDEQELLQGLKQTVAELAPVLLDAENRSQREGLINDWLSWLEDVLYDADNILDELSTEALRRRSMSSINQVCSYFLSSRLKMRQDINKVRERLYKIAAERRDFYLEERSEEQLLMKPDQNTLVEEEGVSREEDRLAIIKLLLGLEFEEDVTVLPIVGVGELGKTTLAKIVFNDEKVQSHFEIRIWVTVSDSFDIEHILTEILVLVRATNRTGGTLEFESLAKRTRDSLYGKRYLIVLDDLWIEDIEKWSHLTRILQAGGKGSKVMITTRSEKVAYLTGTIPPFYLDSLTEDGSWLLFKRIAFAEEPICPYQRAIGMRIVEQCRGVPLAVKAIASILRSKSSEAEWKFFYDNEISRMWDNHAYFQKITSWMSKH